MPTPGDTPTISRSGVTAPQEHGIRRHWRTFWTAWAALFVLSTLWALATPIGAAPDEPAHLVKAASVVRGEFIGAPGDFGHVVHVPQYIAWTHAQTCYAFNDQVSAGCSTAAPGDPGAIVLSTTTAGLYNPVYYLVTGWPSLLFDSEVGVYAMRIMSALFTTVFLALSFMMVATWRRPAIPTLALAVIATPMLLFLAGTINPNGVETTGILAVFVAMLSIVREPSAALLAGRSAVLVVAALAAVNSRGLSPVWLAVAIIVPLFLLPWPRLRELLATRAVIAAIAGVAVVTGFSVAWVIGTSSLTAGIGDSDAPVYPGTGAPAAYGFVFTLTRTFEFGSQLIGFFGWMDTPAPLMAQFVWATLIGGLLLAAGALLRRRELGVTVALLAAFLLLPAIIQGIYITGGGFIWQGRYNFPLFACLLIAAAAFVATNIRPLPWAAQGGSSARRATVIVIAALALSQLYTFTAVLRRYVVGEDNSWLDFVRSPEWQPPGGTIVILVLFAIAAAASALLLARQLRRELSGASASS
ncbi:putative membrane protein DUF2142 [Homoserinimonas aerilata]|uniref:Putative membrane protein DUF2142 n=1 Tax=Homoserinimonas aerilata TaxID=1162970 RepID=A0A542YKM7_9MICO|nr:DUF2142 domain-containing protein [Homoserinimonas aerilata]TQL48646.1 putative membrane protein DUF2142 [Homoserinimonas aerilata]